MTAQVAERRQGEARGGRARASQPRKRSPSWAEERRETLDAIQDLRRRQDLADDRAASMQEKLAAVALGLADVRRTIGELRGKLAETSPPAQEADPAEPSPVSTDEAPATVGAAGASPAGDAAGAPAAMGATGAPATVEAAVAYSPSPLAAPAQRSSWLAPAIQHVAERSGWLASELIGELARVHGRLLDGSLTYELRMEGSGPLLVRVKDGRATVVKTNGDDSELDFRLEGPVAAFAPLVAGGMRRRLHGLRVRGSRRKARRLFMACRRPLALSDLAEADVSVWPDLLLLVLAEATDPIWTAGNEFVVAYRIQGAPDTSIYVRVCRGAPIEVTPRLEHADEPAATVTVSERALLRMHAGAAPLPDEPVLVSGDPEPVRLLCGWFARAQGLGAA